MIASWKIPHLVKGMLTQIPLLNDWRVRHSSTGGSDSASYCYNVWIQHLSGLANCGFRIQGAQVGEIGPGDSIGTGLAALLCGADKYVGLDAIPFCDKADLNKIFQDLVELFLSRCPVSDANELPCAAIDWSTFNDRVEKVGGELNIGIKQSRLIGYYAPWNSADIISPASLDLIFSHCVLEYVESLPDLYQTMFSWLRPGGYSSHYIALNAHYFSPFWNGHWAYSDWEWRIVRGRRRMTLNREPLSVHLRCVRDVGFETMDVQCAYGDGGLDMTDLASRFQAMDAADLRTRGVMLILRKPH